MLSICTPTCSTALFRNKRTTKGLAGLAGPLALCLALCGTAALAQPPASSAGVPGRSAVAAPALSADAQALHAAILRHHDHQGLPFALIDKRGAVLHVFNRDGQRVDSVPVLLGLARGDDSVPGIGERPMESIQPHERTTPAGRFLSEPGRNLQGEDIVWIDYQAAVSIHRLRAVHASQRRAERLASPSVADNRITYGCVNVPARFYDQHLAPVFGRQRAVVYVLPEQRALAEVFGSLLRP